MRQGRFTPLFVVLAVGASGCATGGAVHIAPAPSLWTREDLKARSWTTCAWECENTLRTQRGPIRVATRVRSYGLHEIPGWNGGSTAGRVAGGILGGLIRRQGLSTERVDVRHGTHTIADSGTTTWRLRCSVYSIDDQVEEYSRSDDDHVTRSVRRSEGADCRAFDASDTAVVLWRFRAGIAPPRDSLALVHDSLSRLNPSLVSATPPLTLERLASDGSVAARYDVTREIPVTLMDQLRAAHRLTFNREGGAPVAVIHRASGVTVDFAPDATAEEVRILRMVAAFLTAESR